MRLKSFQRRIWRKRAQMVDVKAIQRETAEMISKVKMMHLRETTEIDSWEFAKIWEVSLLRSWHPTRLLIYFFFQSQTILQQILLNSKCSPKKGETNNQHAKELQEPPKSTSLSQLAWPIQTRSSLIKDLVRRSLIKNRGGEMRTTKRLARMKQNVLWR